MRLARTIALATSLALVAAACSSSSEISEPTTPEIGSTGTTDEATTGTTDDTSASDDPPDDDTPTPEDMPAPDSAEARELFGTAPFTDELTDDETACALSALAEQPALLRRTLQGQTDELPIADQTDLAIIAFDCAPGAVAAAFSEGFTASADLDVPPEVGECFIEAMGEGQPDRRAIVTGFVALGEDQPVPPEARAPVVDTMVRCFPGSVIGDAIAAEALADPALEGAVDAECLGAQLDGDRLRPVWELLVENPALDFDDLDPATIGSFTEGIFACLSFGAIVASQLEPLGIELSAESSACIDREAAGLDPALLTTEEGAAQLGAVMLGCLTPEELTAIGG